MELLNRTLFTLHAEPVTALRLLWAVVAFALVMALAHFGSGIVRKRLFSRGHGNPPTEKSLMRVCRFMAAAFGLIVALRIVGFGLFGPLLFFGLLSLAMALVARDVLANYLAGLVLLYERSVAVGDHIRMAGELGEVEAIRLRVTYVRTPGNARLVVPNRLLMQEAITNLSAPDGRVRLCLAVQVAHGSNTEDVIMTLRKVAERNPRVRRNPGPKSLLTGVVPDGLRFELWAWIGDFADASWVENELYRGIDSEFQRLGIRLSGSHTASSNTSLFSGRRSQAVDYAPTPEPKRAEAPLRSTGRSEGREERSSSGRRRSSAESRQAPEERPTPSETPEVRPPAPAAMDDSTGEPESEPAPKPRRSRTRARTRQRATSTEEGAAATSGAVIPAEANQQESEQGTSLGEFTLLEQPELSFTSTEEAPEEKDAALPTRDESPEPAPEPPAEFHSEAPEAVKSEAPDEPEAAAKPEAAPSQPSFGRSKRKRPRR